jgi:HD superfamily phosphohydrolase
MKIPIERPYIIYDAIHQVMEFPSCFAPLLIDLVNLTGVQRLRHIKQLALSDLIFPTASHTRFSHALGTAFLAWRIIQHIKRQGSFDHFDDQATCILLSAALLHDIGHGPFSHTFEDFLKRIGIELKHEDWTEEILHSPEFVQVFEKHGLKKYIPLIIDLITKKGKKRLDVMASWDPHWLLASDIISSQLDADRLDYLLRDGHFAGVTYGSFDLNWLISCMTTVLWKDKLRLGLTQQGIGSVEHFLIARRLMYQNIYYYPKIIAFETLLVELLLELKVCFAKGAFDIEKLLGPSFSDFLKEASSSKEPNEFKQAAFSHYLRLSDDVIWTGIRNLSLNLQADKKNKTVLDLSRKLCRHETPKVFRVRHEGLARLKLPEVRESIKLPEHEKYKLDLMRVSFSLYSTYEDPIWIWDNSLGEDKAVKLSSRSELVKSLGDKIEPSFYLTIDSEIYKNHQKQLEPFLQELSRNQDI